MIIIIFILAIPYMCNNIGRVNEILDEKREQALNWLKSALKSEKQKMPSGYDILMEEIRKLSKRIDEISQKQKG